MWRILNRWWLWGLLYLAAIPAFAFVYQHLPRPFYHATAHFEPEVQRMRFVLADSLTAEIRRGFFARHPGGQYRVGGWLIHGDLISVASVHRSTNESAPLYVNAPDSPYARFSLTASAVDTTGMVMATCTADLSLDISGPRLPGGLLDYPLVRVRSAAPPSAGVRTTASPILEARGVAIWRSIASSDSFSMSIVQGVLDVAPFGAPTIPLSSEMVNALQDYADAVNGFPARVEGSYSRMLYMSAVTITTLGFGDVVPVTGRARFWTAIEAVFGIVLIGLFLNSVAGKARAITSGGRMPTREQIDAIHDALDRGTQMLERVVFEVSQGDAAKTKETVFEAVRHLGDCKEALRALHARPAATQAVEGTTVEQADRRSQMLRYAAGVRSKAQEHLVTVAAGSLALTVTLRDVAVPASVRATWLLRVSWIAFTLCVVSAIAERLVTSMRMTVHGVGGTVPNKREKVMLAILHGLSLLGFAAGILALVIYGWVNL